MIKYIFLDIDGVIATVIDKDLITADIFKEISDIAKKILEMRNIDRKKLEEPYT